MNKTLITGINGYIARHLAEKISPNVESIHGSVRKIRTKPNDLKISLYETGDLINPIDWNDALENVDTVFHLAGTVHTKNDPKVYNKAILHGTINLVQQAIKKGVKHFVYVSSAAVYGKDTYPELLRETDTPIPNTPYGEAKLAAEYEIIRLTKNTGMSYTIVRPPIVYGDGAPGNVARIKKLVKKLPVLPFGSATQKRSMVSIDNMVDFLITCGTNPNAKNQTFNIADLTDLSTRELCESWAKQINKKLVLLPVPKWIMQMGLTMIGQKSLYNKLFGQLQLSTECAVEMLRSIPCHSCEHENPEKK